MKKKDIKRFVKLSKDISVKQDIDFAIKVHVDNVIETCNEEKNSKFGLTPEIWEERCKRADKIIAERTKVKDFFNLMFKIADNIETIINLKK